MAGPNRVQVSENSWLTIYSESVAWYHRSDGFRHEYQIPVPLRTPELRREFAELIRKGIIST